MGRRDSLTKELDMAKGDHLVVCRALYDHHAIDLGDGTVAQYGGGELGMTDVRVEIISHAVFAQSDAVRNIDNPARFSPAQIVQRAHSRIGEQNYSLLQTNCEHFVNWCRTGQATSRQVDRILERTASCSTKMAAKTVTKVFVKNGAKATAKTFARAATPWFLLADAAQFGTEVVATKLGANDARAETSGQVVGMGASVGIGAAVAGPAGAAAGLGLWVVGEVAGKCFRHDSPNSGQTP